ncbi:cell filamentation protein Fic [Candidatus Shapirobacteria bacterium CG_4_8_14_3_um_filter_35_11]|uniref:Cell filamentation protein Fic n=3 Tax=Candidatus Shapironibacteriota TaxID=1752721 RepID=A0A2M7BN66_9BACT|nr:MAG: cell filamentation protein Fic [Candidatus Shapirobacteria bacterium CG03_land_8_20_14_0_80_35_14]PJC80974.1 MAG: cell filamentation protein Fic [Candidatus Shapirobacteria bacterium CG_4_8_14_3_um_filter_35_11]PJE66660.1 MAG: cell filamentation protein Fic [Candidatus Shapirobacteria bacterium CG10_big_fil_rev_8_21_14_0_10_36_6]
MTNSNNLGEIIIYKGADGEPGIEVRMENETVWLSQNQMAKLFDKDRKTITEHIQNVFKEGELKENSVCRKSQHTAEDDKIYSVNFYNLDVIISVGYRVKSQRGTRFRQWATARLREYLVQGFTMNDEFLKNNGGGLYWKKLLSRIRDIRSSEKMLYRQVLDLYATSADYDPKSLHSIKFFKIVQNKLHYAVHKQTASEVIYNRADSNKEFMGLTAFEGDLPVLEEVKIAKNYLSVHELEKLNRLVSAYFELAELRAMNQQIMHMADHIASLDKLLSDYGEGVLIDAGKVTHKKAIEKAENEYKKFQAKTLSPVEKAYLENIKLLEKKIFVHT